jgi:sulfate permease, SulP family
MSDRAANPNLAATPGFDGPTRSADWILRRIPALDSLRSYSRAAVGRDLTAGLTVATIAIPQAMAYATLAGLPPQYGLYTAMVMTAVGALFDSSRQLINGPTNAISIALLSALAVVPENERIPAAIAIAFLVGAIQLGIAFLRLGDLTRFVSHSVIIGFTIGASLLLVLDQTKHLLGQPARGEPTDHFLKRFWLSLTADGRIHATTLMVGLGTILVVIGIRHLNAALRRRGSRFPIPQHLVAVVLAAGIVWALDLDQRGVKIVGPVPAELPAPQFPNLKWDQVQLAIGNAFAIALLGLLEALAMAKVIAAQTGQRLDVNQQCFSEGAANLVGSFFQCMPGSGSLTRSTVNQQAGAVSQWSGVFAAAAVALTVVMFAPLAYYIPRASLAGLLMLAGYRMIDGKQLFFHFRATRLDAGVIIVTALAAVLISIEFCILIGVFLSFALYVPRAAQVRLQSVSPLPDEFRRMAPGEQLATGEVLAFDLEGELFFGSEAEIAKHFKRIERSLPSTTGVVILRLEHARNPDAAFLNLLAVFHSRLAEKQWQLLLYAVQPDLRAAIGRTGLNVSICESAAQQSQGQARNFLDETRS